MGNALRKVSDGPIDGGDVKRLTNRSSPTEYDSGMVKKLINARRMAPFYEGKAETTEGSAVQGSLPSSPSSATSLDFSSEPAESHVLIPSPPPASTSNKSRRRIFSRRKKSDRDCANALPDPALQSLLTSFQTECPICFLYFPRNINYTSCCQQPLCTSCFLNLRRPPSGRTISCPFCNRRDLAISYRPPHVLLQEEGLSDTDRVRLFRPNPVKWESLRPYQPPPPPPSAAYRAATASSRYAHYAGPPFSVRSGQRTTTYGRGVLVLYDANGQPMYVTEEYPSGMRQQAYGYSREGTRYAPAITRTRHANDFYYRPGQYAYPGQSYRRTESNSDASYRHFYPMVP